jgi:hypothetical protein
MKVPAEVNIFDRASTWADPTMDVDDSGISTILFQAGEIEAASFRLFSFAGYRNVVTDYKNAIDRSTTTYASITNAAGQIIEFIPDDLPQGSVTVQTGEKNLIFYIIVDSIVSADSYKIGYVDEYGTEVENKELAASAGGIIQTSFTIYNGTTKLIENVEDLSKYRFYVRKNEDHSPAAETTKIYGAGLMVWHVISNNNKIVDLKYKD